ncbi:MULTISPECIES: PTS fructose transporter subunit IIB [Virgibacillus]|uniref:PTS fructose transporter subunit IIB n=1 Tax=Virgibacillus dokdonensis TaxID=302167 RepID=A0A2K9IWP7_9BACI|nr:MULTISPECIES: PTS fructose transporter subunit IIB [Virgibacillus]AUJ24186.1 PTS system, Lactose/Cellobiose specific IIB subunit [Virgibacillus dokdonensis]NWO12447.1 PTS fructose transporter subunit IIB [Virgibacillus sp.]
MIKILAACGAGINSSHQIKTAIEEEMKKRGYDVKVDAVVVKDINKEMMDQYDIFTPISKIKFSFDINIPTIEAGPILYRIPAMAEPVFEELVSAIKKIKK